MVLRRTEGIKRWFLENEVIEGRQALSDYFHGLGKASTSACMYLA